MELWLPWLYITAAGPLFVGSIWLFWKKKMERKSAHLVIQIVGRITSPVLFLATIFLLLGVGCERHSQLIGSPDGQHVARVLVTVGSAVDQDYSTVIVRRSWSPVWTKAYFGIGLFDGRGSIEPLVKWLDDTHLLIKYPETNGYPLDCATKVGNIAITCQPHR